MPRAEPTQVQDAKRLLLTICRLATWVSGRERAATVPDLVLTWYKDLALALQISIPLYDIGKEGVGSTTTTTPPLGVQGSGAAALGLGDDEGSERYLNRGPELEPYVDKGGCDGTCIKSQCWEVRPLQPTGRPALPIGEIQASERLSKRKGKVDSARRTTFKVVLWPPNTHACLHTNLHTYVHTGTHIYTRTNRVYGGRDSGKERERQRER